jgi:hypothetical protein
MKSIVFLCSENARIGWFDGPRTQYALRTSITSVSHHLDDAYGQMAAEQNIAWNVLGWAISVADEESLRPLAGF